MKILFASSEVSPFAASGGLADVAGSLPIALAAGGCDIRVALPLYARVSPEWRAKMRFLCHFDVPLSWRRQYCGVFLLEDRGVTYYFLDNEYYFKRDSLYGYYDDGERFAFFSRAVLELLRHIDFAPDILHCNDWQTALIPVYLQQYRGEPQLAHAKTLFTIHNIQYQGIFGGECLGDLFGLPESALPLLEWNGCLNLMKAAVELADKVNTVSPTYAREILDPWFSFGLNPLLAAKQYKTCGILNGIDDTVYDPARDPLIAARFSADDPSGKALCKKELLREFGLPDDGRPLCAMVTRLVSQKGLDLVKYVLAELLQSGVQFLLLGSGDAAYENAFRGFAARYPESCSVKIGFLPALSKKIYAGADLFLMPSKTEPCGLSQMMALRYGTIPVVRRTGGLADSVADCGDGAGNGFTFQSYNAHDMLAACLRAKALYGQPQEWDALVRRALRCDFSWGAAAKSYRGLYEEMRTLW